MKKRLLAVLLFAEVFALLTGCAGGRRNTTVNDVSRQDSTGFSSEYDYFSGERVYTIEVKEEPLDVKISVTTVSGKIAMTVGRAGYRPDYAGNTMETGAFTVTLSESGTYEVRIQAEAHKGGYAFAWGK